MISLAIDLLLLALGYGSFWFIISMILERNDIADVAWGLGYIGLSVYLYLTQPSGELSTLVYILVMLWGGRLSIHIGTRNRKKKEDFRYNQWRRDWGKSFYWRSYLQVYLLQVLLLLVISIPIIIVSQSELNAWSMWTYIGLMLWVTGYFWQVVGDYQLSQFKKQKTEKDQVMQSGLWKYSRHPNYFGEIMMWFGIATIVIPVVNGWFGLISPVLITYLLLKVSGVPMLEKRYRGVDAFERYKKKTPAVFPNLWLK